MTAWRDRRGVTTAEFGLLALPLVMFLFGVIEFGLVIRMKSALQYAAINASRCAAVDLATCATTAAVKSYAVSMSQGVNVTADTFTVTNETCGKKVVASVAFPVSAQSVLTTGLTVTAQACYPLQPG